MFSFFDLKLQPNLTPKEYCESLTSPIKKLMTSEMFDHLELLISQIMINNNVLAAPTIKIDTESNSLAEGMHGVILIGSAFIDHCLSMQQSPHWDLIEPQPDEPDLRCPPNLFFLWSIAHEFFHGVRRHNTALDQLDKNCETYKAIEVDADMCAAASIYRFAQHSLRQEYSDMTIRKLILSSVFWGLGQLPRHENSSETHPPLTQRIYHLFAKICHIRKNIYDPADPECATPETQENTIYLSKFLVSCADQYQKTNNDLLTFKPELIDIVKNKKWRPLVTEWEDIKGVVENASKHQ
ncbi:MAG: hypothetical protein VR76_01820 [Pseudomonas sp. BRH_c35]|nr:MAG: hypothetical protein VR76_01820 [Pseudomonas sp. BRH_c35]